MAASEETHETDSTQRMMSGMLMAKLQVLNRISSQEVLFRHVAMVPRVRNPHVGDAARAASLSRCERSEDRCAFQDVTSRWSELDHTVSRNVKPSEPIQLLQSRRFVRCEQATVPPVAETSATTNVAVSPHGHRPRASVAGSAPLRVSILSQLLSTPLRSHDAFGFLTSFDWSPSRDA